MAVVFLDPGYPTSPGVIQAQPMLLQMGDCFLLQLRSIPVCVTLTLTLFICICVRMYVCVHTYMFMDVHSWVGVSTCG